jgi:hypothetical protein
MVDLLVTRLLPAVLFGLAAGGLLWLIGLVRKRAALATAAALALIFLAGRWSPTFVAATQIVLAAVCGRVLVPTHRLRLRDIVGLTTAGGLAAWGGFVGGESAYWSAALVGGLAGAGGLYVARAASTRWSATRLRLLTLRPVESGGINGPGAVAGVLVAALVAAAAASQGVLGPGETALPVVGAVVGVAAADFVVRARPGLTLVAGGLGAVATAGLVAYLP